MRVSWPSVTFVLVLSACKLDLSDDEGFVDSSGTAVPGSRIVTTFTPQFITQGAARVSDRQALVAGVIARDGSYARKALLVDLTSGAIDELAYPFPSTQNAGYGFAVTALADDRVLLLEIQPSGSTSALYDVASRSFRTLTTPEIGGEHVLRLKTGDVLWSAGPRRSAVFDASAESWSTLPVQEGSALDGASVLLDDGRVFMTGLASGSVDSGAAAFLYDPGARTFTRVSAPPDERDFAAAVVLPDGRVLLAGGRVDDTLVATTLLFDPVAGSWSPGPTLAEPRGFATAARNGESVYVFGGIADEPCAAADCAVVRVERLERDAGAFVTAGELHPSVSPSMLEFATSDFLAVSGLGVFRFPIPR